MIKEYENAEKMFKDIEKMVAQGREAAKHHHIKVDQLRHGDHFAYVHHSGVPIFGEVIESTEYEEDSARENGFIFGRCYSELCPNGELGDTHVTHITHKVSKEDFERARANGWRHLLETN